MEPTQFIELDKEETRAKIYRPTLSCTMMVKDEVKYLGKAIATSFHIIDELVIGIDRKSNDGTRVIAEKWVKKVGRGEVYTFDWIGDFSAIRNLGISKCHMEWIFILDGHEYFEKESQGRLMDMWNAAGNTQPQALTLSVINKEAKTTLYQIRFFKNFIGTHFEDKVHNRLVAPDVSKITAVQGVKLIHERSRKDGAVRKVQRETMVYDGMQEVLKNKPDDIRALHYLARQCLDLKKYRDSEVYHIKFLKYVTDPLERHITKWNMSHALLHQHKMEECLKILRSAIKDYPQLPHAYIQLGLLANSMEGDTKKAEHYFREAIRRNKIPMAHVSMASGPFTWIPWFHTAILYHQRGDRSRALSCFRQSIAYDDITIEAIDHICQLFGKGRHLLFLEKRRAMAEKLLG